MEESLMKMYEILELPNLYESIANMKLSLKTSYKFNRLMRRAEEEIAFYQQKFKEIVDEYGVKENGEYKFTPDGSSVLIVPGKESECNEKLIELRNLDIPITNITFSIDELDGLDVSIS